MEQNPGSDVATPKRTIYLDPMDDEIVAQFRGMGHEVRPGVTGACEECGFLSMKGRDDGHVVFDHCVCAIRRQHAADCEHRRVAESPIDIGIDHHDVACTCNPKP